MSPMSPDAGVEVEIYNTTALCISASSAAIVCGLPSEGSARAGPLWKLGSGNRSRLSLILKALPRARACW